MTILTSPNLGAFKSNVDPIDHLLAFDDLPCFQVNAFWDFADCFVDRGMKTTLGENIDQHRQR